jgi:hypothetical protein
MWGHDCRPILHSRGATSPLLAFVFPRHKLAPRRNLTLEQLADHPFLLLDLPISWD